LQVAAPLLRERSNLENFLLQSAPILDPPHLCPTASIALLLPASFRDYGYVCRLLTLFSAYCSFYFILFFSLYLLTSPDHTAAALCIDMSTGFEREN
jgi:hypothetical protein